MEGAERSKLKKVLMRYINRDASSFGIGSQGNYGRYHSQRNASVVSIISWIESSELLLSLQFYPVAEGYTPGSIPWPSFFVRLPAAAPHLMPESNKRLRSQHQIRDL